MVSHFLRQTWTVSGVLLNMLAQGMVLSFPSSLLPALGDPASPIQADLDTKSWIASSVGLAGIPGFWASAMLMDNYGRRNTQIVAILPGLVGWLIIYYSTGVATLLIGRILTGYSSGASVGLGAVVIGEYSSPSHRGTFLNLKTASVCMGGMTTHILGHFLTWRGVALATMIPNIVALGITYTWPESPAWLARRKEIEKTEESFLWLRGNDERSIQELNDLLKSQINNMKQKKSYKQSIRDLFKKFTRKDFLKPTFIIMSGGLLIEVSGRHIFPAYALDIMGQITDNKSQSNQSFYYTLAIDLIITSSATFSAVLVRIMKRRILLLATGFASILVLASACTYLFLAARGLISNEHTWIPMSLFVVYFIVVNLGCNPVPLCFLGELLPLEHKAVGSLLAGTFICLCVNAGLQVTPILLINVKVYGTFAIFGACMGILLVILYFMMPETKDRTLQEIEYYFNNGKFDDRVHGENDVTMKMLVNASCNTEKL